MIRVTTFEGKHVAVFGLGSSGNAAARALISGGANVAAWDDGESGRASAAKAGIPLTDLTSADWTSFAALVLAPGVPLTHPMPHWTVERARAAGVEIIGDVELFCRERAAICPDAPFIAITGTNGKSTTTALIAHILRSAGKDVQMGGNIGIPILDLEPPASDRWHIVEMSSFQIDLTPSLAPTVGVLLNVTPDHLDRHGSIEAYAAVKERLVASAAHAVIGIDDDWSRAILDRRNLAMGDRGYDVSTPVSVVSALTSGCFRDGCDLVYQGVRKAFQHGSPIPGQFVVEAPRDTVCLDGIGSLRGGHNAQNACAAYAALRAASIEHRAIADHLATFPGLAHRMEQLGHIETPQGRVLVVNDSKATNADSAEKALLSFPGDIHWIIGGKPKDGGIEALRPLFNRVARAYLIGAATEEFAATLDGTVAYERCGTLDVAAARAREAVSSSLESSASAVILFSPACASFDQFQNFEKRGDAFRAAVARLPGFVPIAGQFEDKVRAGSARTDKADGP